MIVDPVSLDIKEMKQDGGTTGKADVIYVCDYFQVAEELRKVAAKGDDVESIGSGNHSS
jgi:hypothetical protein